MIYKKCCRCKKTKCFTDFPMDRREKDGRIYCCKECRRIYEDSWRDRNRESRKLKQREYYQKNKKEISRKRKENYSYIKSRARSLAKKIKAGKCLFCNEIGERHHKNYNYPMDVVFLCKSHHKRIHDGTLKL